MKLASWAIPLPTQPLNLFPAEVHVWRAGLALDAGELERLQKVLSPDEQARARRFCFEKDRQRFIASRGILREILARYLKLDPARLAFSYGRFGKPSLAPDELSKRPSLQPVSFARTCPLRDRLLS